MRWHLSNRADYRALPIADRHYNRQKVGSRQFVPPGRCSVFLTERADALWVTSYPFPQYVKHEWPGSWICSCFRNESDFLSSELIREAISATQCTIGNPPALGMITFVNSSKVKKKRDPGRCFIKAGFRKVGYTKGGLLAFQILPEEMPCPEPPFGQTGTIFSSDRYPYNPETFHA